MVHTIIKNIKQMTKTVMFTFKNLISLLRNHIIHQSIDRFRQLRMVNHQREKFR